MMLIIINLDSNILNANSNYDVPYFNMQFFLMDITCNLKQLLPQQLIMKTTFTNVVSLLNNSVWGLDALKANVSNFC